MAWLSVTQIMRAELHQMLAAEEARLAKALEELGRIRPMVYSGRRGKIWRRWPDGRIDLVRHVSDANQKLPVSALSVTIPSD